MAGRHVVCTFAAGWNLDHVELRARLKLSNIFELRAHALGRSAPVLGAGFWRGGRSPFKIRWHAKSSLIISLRQEDRDANSQVGPSEEPGSRRQKKFKIRK